MEVNNPAVIQDGDASRNLLKAPSPVVTAKQTEVEGTKVKRKRRRGKTKRKMMKPYIKKPWLDRRRNEKPKRDNRYRSLGLAKTHAPFNNNQFLMEIHKPEPENNFQILQTPSGRTRDSSFSVDSDENYFYSLPEDEEDFLTKEFSSVYEDAQSERLSNMSKTELIQEYLLLEAKYDNLIKRTDRSKVKNQSGENMDSSSESDKDVSITDKDSMITDKDTTGTSVELSVVDEPIQDYMNRLKEQEDQIRELKLANEKLKVENEHLRQKSNVSSSEDSESDSSSTTISSSSSSSKPSSPAYVANGLINGEVNGHNAVNGVNEEPLLNGYGPDHEENE